MPTSKNNVTRTTRIDKPTASERMMGQAVSPDAVLHSTSRSRIVDHRQSPATYSDTTPNKKGKGKAKAVVIFDDESPNDPSQGNPDTHSYTNSEAEFREVAEASRKEAQLALNHARKAETSSDGPGTSSSPEPTSPVHNSSNSSLSARPIGHREEINGTDVFGTRVSSVRSQVRDSERDVMMRQNTPPTQINSSLHGVRQFLAPSPASALHYNDEDSISPDIEFRARRRDPLYLPQAADSRSAGPFRATTTTSSLRSASSHRPPATLRPASQPKISNDDDDGNMSVDAASSSSATRTLPAPQPRNLTNRNRAAPASATSPPPPNAPSTNNDHDMSVGQRRSIAALPRSRRAITRPAVGVSATSLATTSTSPAPANVLNPNTNDEDMTPAQRPIAGLPRRRTANLNQAASSAASNNSVADPNNTGISTPTALLASQVLVGPGVNPSNVDLDPETMQGARDLLNLQRRFAAQNLNNAVPTGRPQADLQAPTSTSNAAPFTVGNSLDDKQTRPIAGSNRVKTAKVSNPVSFKFVPPTALTGPGMFPPHSNPLSTSVNLGNNGQVVSQSRAFKDSLNETDARQWFDMDAAGKSNVSIRFMKPVAVPLENRKDRDNSEDYKLDPEAFEAELNQQFIDAASNMEDTDSHKHAIDPYSDDDDIGDSAQQEALLDAAAAKQDGLQENDGLQPDQGQERRVVDQRSHVPSPSAPLIDSDMDAVDTGAAQPSTSIPMSGMRSSLSECTIATLSDITDNSTHPIIPPTQHHLPPLTGTGPPNRNYFMRDSAPNQGNEHDSDEELEKLIREFKKKAQAIRLMEIEPQVQQTASVPMEEDGLETPAYSRSAPIQDLSGPSGKQSILVDSHHSVPFAPNQGPPMVPTSLPTYGPEVQRNDTQMYEAVVAGSEDSTSNDLQNAVFDSTATPTSGFSMGIEETVEQVTSSQVDDKLLTKAAIASTLHTAHLTGQPLREADPNDDHAADRSRLASASDSMIQEVAFGNIKAGFAPRQTTAQLAGQLQQEAIPSTDHPADQLSPVNSNDTSSSQSTSVADHATVELYISPGPHNGPQIGSPLTDYSAQDVHANANANFQLLPESVGPRNGQFGEQESTMTPETDMEIDALLSEAAGLDIPSELLVDQNGPNGHQPDHTPQLNSVIPSDHEMTPEDNTCGEHLLSSAALVPDEKICDSATQDTEIGGSESESESALDTSQLASSTDSSEAEEPSGDALVDNLIERLSNLSLDDIEDDATSQLGCLSPLPRRMPVVVMEPMEPLPITDNSGIGEEKNSSGGPPLESPSFPLPVKSTEFQPADLDEDSTRVPTSTSPEPAVQCAEPTSIQVPESSQLNLGLPESNADELCAPSPAPTIADTEEASEAATQHCETRVLGVETLVILEALTSAVLSESSSPELAVKKQKKRRAQKPLYERGKQDFRPYPDPSRRPAIRSRAARSEGIVARPLQREIHVQEPEQPQPATPAQEASEQPQEVTPAQEVAEQPQLEAAPVQEAPANLEDSSTAPPNRPPPQPRRTLDDIRLEPKQLGGYTLGNTWKLVPCDKRTYPKRTPKPKPPPPKPYVPGEFHRRAQEIMWRHGHGIPLTERPTPPTLPPIVSARMAAHESTPLALLEGIAWEVPVGLRPAEIVMVRPLHSGEFPTAVAAVPLGLGWLWKTLGGQFGY